MKTIEELEEEERDILLGKCAREADSTLILSIIALAFSIVTFIIVIILK